MSDAIEAAKGAAEDAACRPIFGSPLSPQFVRRVVEVAPGRSQPYADSEWADAIVLVEHGEIELEGMNGDRLSCVKGALLCFAGLSLRTVHNRGDETVVLVAFSRRPGPS